MFIKSKNGTSCAKLVVLDQPKVVGEVEHLRQSLGQIRAIAGEAVISRKVFARLIAKH